MDRRRIAEILRRRAQLDLELADAFETDEPANDTPPTTRPPKRTEPLPEPKPPTEVDVARARRALSKRGYR